MCGGPSLFCCLWFLYQFPHQFPHQFHHQFHHQFLPSMR